MDTPEGDPVCDITGECEPFDDEADQPIAMCRHCGGERYRDHPFPGNWGTWTPDLIVRLT
jgi:hypothetical protein